MPASEDSLRKVSTRPRSRSACSATNQCADLGKALLRAKLPNGVQRQPAPFDRSLPQELPPPKTRFGAMCSVERRNSLRPSTAPTVAEPCLCPRSPCPRQRTVSGQPPRTSAHHLGHRLRTTERSRLKAHAPRIDGMRCSRMPCLKSARADARMLRIGDVHQPCPHIKKACKKKQKTD